jgi:hypothetical protein
MKHYEVKAETYCMYQNMKQSIFILGHLKLREWPYIHIFRKCCAEVSVMSRVLLFGILFRMGNASVS